MTYYVTKSNWEGDGFPYLCVNSNLNYEWFRSLASITPYKLSARDTEFSTIEDWLDDLPNTTMTLLYSFTEQSHPELFI